MRTCLGLALLISCVACAGADTRGGSELVYRVDSPRSVEDGGVLYEVSPDEAHGLYAAHDGYRLIDLRNTGNESATPQRIANVTSAVFHGAEGLARLGPVNGFTAWYIETSVGLLRSELPPDAQPRWSPDGTNVAYFRPGQPKLFVGRAVVVEHELGGAVTGIGWSPAGDAVYALVTDSGGLSSLVRVETELRAVSLVAGRLATPRRLNSIGVSADGRSLYVSVAPAAHPDSRGTDIYELDALSGEARPVVTTSGDDAHPVVAGAHLYWTHSETGDGAVVELRRISLNAGAARSGTHGGYLDTARYAIAVIALLTVPPAIIYWLLLHPFIGFWRTRGLGITYSALAAMFTVSMAALWLVRDRMLTREYGTGWWLWVLAMSAYAASIVIELKCRKHLKLKTLVGVPEVRSVQRDRVLLHEGIYGRVRHPRYTSFLFGMLAMALFANYLATYVLFAASVASIYVIAKLEELELAASLGPPYEEYRRRVPMFVPRWR